MGAAQIAKKNVEMAYLIHLKNVIMEKKVQDQKMVGINAIVNANGRQGCQVALTPQVHLALAPVKLQEETNH